jgi:hypothetical protein
MAADIETAIAQFIIRDIKPKKIMCNTLKIITVNANAMKREEEINLATRNAFLKAGVDKESYRQGAEWADRHPRQGLVDIDKACAWLAENFIGECGYIATEGTYISFNTKPAVEAFRKAMEEQI